MSASIEERIALRCERGTTMEAHPLQIQSIDFLSHERFIIYFSDNTCLVATAELLAKRFPDRMPAPHVSDAARVREGTQPMTGA
jgi:hypothetical protein